MDHAQRSYLEWIHALCGSVPFSGVHVMRDVAPPALDDIFVELTVRKELRRRPRVFHEEVESSLDVSDQTDTVGSTSTLSPPTGGASPPLEYREYLEARESPPMSIQQALAEARRCVLLGGPGSGKSTLVRHLAFSLCAWLLAPEGQPCAYRQLQGLVPVPVLLRHFAKRLLEHPELSLADYLKDYNMQDLVLGAATRQQQSEGIPAPVHEDVPQDRLLFLFDGLDEAREPRLKAVLANRITEYLAGNEACMALITSRPVGYDEARLPVETCLLQPFDTEQRRTFFGKWFLFHESRVPRPGQTKEDTHAAGEIAKRQAEALTDELMTRLKEHAQIAQLATNPLLCTLIGFIYYRRRVFPARRADLYKDCLETFLYSWEEAKQTRDFSGLVLDREQDLRVLEEAALWLHDKTTDNLIPEDKLRAIVDRVGGERSTANQETARGYADSFIAVATEISGLLAEQGLRDGQRVFGFTPHLSFQEYLVARALCRERRRPYTYLSNRIDHARWQEVFRLCAAELSRRYVEDATEFVLAIRKEPFRYKKHDLEPLLRRRLRQALWCLADDVEIAPDAARELVQEGFEDFDTFSRNEEMIGRKEFLRLGNQLRGTRYGSFLDALVQELPSRVTERGAGRLLATDALGKLTVAEDVPWLMELLTDSAAMVRRAAAGAFGKIGATDAVPRLMEMLEDGDAELRTTAVYALGKLGATEAVPRLVELLKHGDAGVRRTTADALGALGARDAVPQLMELLQDNDEEVRATAAFACAQLGAREAVPRLMELLKDSDADVRDAAADALGALGARDAVPRLMELLEDGDAGVRQTAADALSVLGATDAVPRLMELLQDNDEEVRATAAYACARLDARGAVPRLMDIIKENNQEERRAAAYALAELGAREAVPLLMKSLEDSDAWMRRVAAEALAKLGAREAVPWLVEMIKDSNKGVRATAADALGTLNATKAIPRHTELLTDSDNNVRRVAASALVKLGATEAVPRLMELLTDSDAWVHGAAANALGTLGAGQHLDRIVKLYLENPTPETGWLIETLMTQGAA